MSPPIVVIIGCTGSGKGAVGREVARCIGAEIVSVDSMKIYRRMDIGTAKPSRSCREQIPHHLIDVAEPSEEFSVARFVELVERAITDIQVRGRLPLLVGGTLLYLKALTDGLFEGPAADPSLRARYQDLAAAHGVAALHDRLARVDPETAQRVHPNDLRRIVRALEVYELTGRPISSLQTQWDRGRPRCDLMLLGIRRTREDQSHRTNQRVVRMIEAGWVREVQSLLAEPQPLSTTARKALGYAEIIRHVRGEIPLAEAAEMAKIRTRRFAKAQRTWFRRFTQAQWIDVVPDEASERIAEQLLRRIEESWSPSPK